MASVKKLSAFRDWFLSSFTKGESPLVPQILIGLGSVSFMPTIIATNKNEKPENRLNAAARTFVQEGIALPIALGTAIGAGCVGAKLAKGSAFKPGIVGLTTTIGFAVANLFIPTLTTKIMHKLPIKEKIEALTIKKQGGKLDVTSETPAIALNSSDKPGVLNPMLDFNSPNYNPFNYKALADKLKI